MKTPKKAGNRKANNIKSTKITKLTKPNKFTKLKNLAAFAVIAFFAGTMLLPALKNINAASTVYEIRTEADIEQALADTTNTDITLKFMNDVKLTKPIMEYRQEHTVARDITFTADTPRTISAAENIDWSLIGGQDSGYGNTFLYWFGSAGLRNFELNNIILDYTGVDRSFGALVLSSTVDGGDFTMSGDSAMINLHDCNSITFTQPNSKSHFIMKDNARIENVIYNDSTIYVGAKGIYASNIIMEGNSRIANVKMGNNIALDQTYYITSLLSTWYNKVGSITLRGNAKISAVDFPGGIAVGDFTMSGNAQIVDNSLGYLVHAPNNITLEGESLISRNEIKRQSTDKTSFYSMFEITHLNGDDNPDAIIMRDNAEISHHANVPISMFSRMKSFTMRDHARIAHNEFVRGERDSIAHYFVGLFHNIGGTNNGKTTTLTMNDDAEISNNTRRMQRVNEKNSMQYPGFIGTLEYPIAITLNQRAKINNNSVLVEGELAPEFPDSDYYCALYGSGVIHLSEDENNPGSLTMNDESEISGNYNECGNGGAVGLSWGFLGGEQNGEIRLNGGTMANNRTPNDGGAIGYPSIENYIKYFEAAGEDVSQVDTAETRAALAPEKFLSRIHVGENFTFSGNRAASLHNIQPEDQALYNANVKTNKFSAGTSAYNNYDIQYLKGDPIPETKPDENPDQPENPENPSEPGNPENPENPSSENSGDTENQAENNNFAIQNKKSPAKQFKLIAPNTGKI